MLLFLVYNSWSSLVFFYEDDYELVIVYGTWYMYVFGAVSPVFRYGYPPLETEIFGVFC